jgi:hypothetical protein
MNIYRLLGHFLEACDTEAQARGEGPEDKSVRGLPRRGHIQFDSQSYAHKAPCNC